MACSGVQKSLFRVTLLHIFSNLIKLENVEKKKTVFFTEKMSFVIDKEEFVFRKSRYEAVTVTKIICTPHASISSFSTNI